MVEGLSYLGLSGATSEDSLEQNDGLFSLLHPGRRGGAGGRRWTGNRLLHLLQQTQWLGSLLTCVDGWYMVCT